MELGKDVKSILEERFREWRDRFFRDVERYIKKIRTAKTEEEIMEAKRDLLVSIVQNLPLSKKYCPFCLIYNSNCDKCSHAKQHGDCHEYDSDYSIMLRARNNFIDALKLYYKGEKYSFTSMVKYLLEKVRDVYENVNEETLSEDKREKIEKLLEIVEIVDNHAYVLIDNKGTRVSKEVQKKLVDDLEAWKARFFEKIDVQLKKIEEADTIEEYVYAKKRLSECIVVSLPIGASACYFCKKYKCCECTYAVYHGNCYESDSDYRKIVNAQEEMLDAIDPYVGEIY